MKDSYDCDPTQMIPQVAKVFENLGKLTLAIPKNFNEDLVDQIASELKNLPKEVLDFCCQEDVTSKMAIEQLKPLLLTLLNQDTYNRLASDTVLKYFDAAFKVALLPRSTAMPNFDTWWDQTFELAVKSHVHNVKDNIREMLKAAYEQGFVDGQYKVKRDGPTPDGQYHMSE